MSINKVKAYLSQFQRENSIIEFPVSSATTAEAANAAHCAEGRIAKTISAKLNDTAVLIVISGDKKIDGKKYKQYFGKKFSMLKADEVEPMTGHRIGGVCPFAVNTGIKIYLDISLQRFPTVFPACGSSNSAIELTTAELEKYSKAAAWIDISKDNM